MEERADECSSPCSDNSAIPFSYIEPNLTLTHAQINHIRDENIVFLFGRKKLQLVLDLDHTLIHSKKAEKLKLKEKQRIESAEDVYYVMEGKYVVKLRPGIREFLKDVGSMFDVTVYTKGEKAYAKAMHELLESEAGFPKGSWLISRNDCVSNSQKSLDVVLSHERVVLIVDDTEEVWANSGSKNLVKIGRYNFFPVKKASKGVDMELGRVMAVLRRVHTAFFKGNKRIVFSKRDVRDILKSISPTLDDTVDAKMEDSASDVETKKCKKLVVKFNGKRLRSNNDIMEAPACQQTVSVPVTGRWKRLVIKSASLAY